MAYQKTSKEPAVESTTVIRSEAERQTQTPHRQRVPMGVPRTKLTVPYLVEGYHLHWINDENDRLFSAVQGGYEHVSPTEVGLPEGAAKIKKLVGRQENGESLYAYLMKIKQEYYDEDQKALQAQVDVFEDALRRGQSDDSRFNRSSYIPKEGIKIR